MALTPYPAGRSGNESRRKMVHLGTKIILLDDLIRLFYFFHLLYSQCQCFLSELVEAWIALVNRNPCLLKDVWNDGMRIGVNRVMLEVSVSCKSDMVSSLVQILFLSRVPQGWGLGPCSFTPHLRHRSGRQFPVFHLRFNEMFLLSWVLNYMATTIATKNPERKI